ncbi:MAG: Sulfite exporter TauE/SafE, partial [Gaiellaceae bacterium]|nr:Sulfite exporter TauE/SafE [Gaiellaceae bacterium]
MHGLVLAGVGLWCFVVALVGGLLGLVLGNIRLPVLLLVGSNPAAAAGANIAVSGLAAATASVTHIRAGRVHWRLVAWMLPPSVVGAVGGAYAAGRLPAETLRL